MSFQGDVAGIGLGELLQGLSRGGRDGVLSLHGDKLSSAIGLHKGQLFILPSPDEEEGTWRDRAQQAFADDPHPHVEAVRRTSIARAGRLEIFYQMLEAPNLHFRFDPGALPTPAAPRARNISLAGVTKAADEMPWGPGFTVEYMLLEHARIADESSSGPAAQLSGHDMPRALDPSRHPVQIRDFLEQCNGNSTLQEIADRLAQPLSQVRAVIGEHVTAGTVRLAQPRELLASAQRELELGRIGRAASRLSGWIAACAPGPPPVGDANLLVNEWETGRLGHILHALAPSSARSLLRKLDHVHADARASLERWQHLQDAHRNDEITVIHRVALKLSQSDEPESAVFHDLLRLARSFQERGFSRRTRTLLRLAANHLPARPHTRIELGRRMLETGLVQEGTRWLLDTARELNDRGEPDKAIVPLRAVLREMPDHAEASGLLIETRALITRRKRRRFNAAAALATGLVLSVAALVRFRAHRDVERRIAEINSYVSRPGEALELIEQYFGDSPPARVEDLRQQVLRIKREEDRKSLDSWIERYSRVEEECKFGDPLRAVRQILELPPPPVARSDEPWTDRQDLLGVLAARLGTRSKELDFPIDAPYEELHQEERFVSLLDEILAIVPRDTAPPEAQSFQFRVAELRDAILRRSEERAVGRKTMLEKRKLKEQDILLATARAHDAAGDLERSVAAYDRLIETEPGLATLPELSKEIASVQSHWRATQRAIELASRGEHEAAAAALDGACPRPVEHLLPMKVRSLPGGARVKLPDGTIRVAPFIAHSAVGESVTLHFEAPGHEPRSVSFDRPRDLALHLHRVPERAWSEGRSVTAIPLPVGDDHVVADRHGHVVRLDARGNARWDRRLPSLGGIARTPVFLPGKPGHMLFLSEDGLAFLINAATGEVQGPRDVGSPPTDGPTLTRGGVTASFADGRIAVWTSALEPSFYSADGMLTRRGAPEEREGPNSTLAVLRRSARSGSELLSPWTSWRVSVREDELLVVGPDGRGFTAAREGDWLFVAWESPKALLSQGRLWISDERGLRSYEPPPADKLVAYP